MLAGEFTWKYTVLSTEYCVQLKVHGIYIAHWTGRNLHCCVICVKVFKCGAEEPTLIPCLASQDQMMFFLVLVLVFVSVLICVCVCVCVCIYSNAPRSRAAYTVHYHASEPWGFINLCFNFCICIWIRIVFVFVFGIDWKVHCPQCPVSKPQTKVSWAGAVKMSHLYLYFK